MFSKCPRQPVEVIALCCIGILISQVICVHPLPLFNGRPLEGINLPISALTFICQIVVFGLGIGVNYSSKGISFPVNSSHKLLSLVNTLPIVAVALPTGDETVVICLVVT